MANATMNSGSQLSEKQCSRLDELRTELLNELGKQWSMRMLIFSGILLVICLGLFIGLNVWMMGLEEITIGYFITANVLCAIIFLALVFFCYRLCRSDQDKWQALKGTYEYLYKEIQLREIFSLTNIDK